MKYRFFLILQLFCFVFANAVAQNSVSEEEAILVAKTVAANQRGDSNVDFVKKLVDTGNNVLLYEVIMEDNNVVLLSGNKACVPVLGSYKNPGISIVDDFDLIPCGLKSLVNDYLQQIAWCNEEGNRLVENPQWSTLIYGSDSSLRNRQTVGPLLHSKWGQIISNDSLDNTAYNEFAPDSGCVGGSTHCPAGCVAVAMGQIMKYWSYPFFITEYNNLFDWCNMSEELRMVNPCYSFNKKAINTLLEACGSSVDMTYECGGSGANTFDAEVAFRDIFHYESGVTRYTVNLLDHYSYPNMFEIIINEIDENRPVLMSAHDYHSGGHAFVCDGYRTGNSTEFHFNWGWNGAFNGFFVYYQLNPDIYTFVAKGIVYKIMPDIQYYTQSIVHLGNFYSNYLTNNYQPYRLVPGESDKLYSASVSCSTSWRTIPNNTTSIYQAHEEIILQDGFTSEWGSDFLARITKCCDGEQNRYTLNETDITDSNYDDEYRIKNSIANPKQSQLNHIFPNPTDGELTMTVDGEVEAVVILDISGNPQGGWDFLALTKDWITLDVHRLQAGAYILTVRHPGGRVETARFFKQ